MNDLRSFCLQIHIRHLIRTLSNPVLPPLAVYGLFLFIKPEEAFLGIYFEKIKTFPQYRRSYIGVGNVWLISLS